MKRLLAVGFLGVLVVAIIVVALVPLMDVVYYEQEAYITTESYSKTEVYTEEIPVEYEVTENKVNNIWWRPASECHVIVSNAGNESGYFRIQFNILTQSGKDVTRAVWLHVPAGEDEKAIVRHEGDYVKSFDYEITPPTRLVTKSRQVPATREVTAYRSVEKTDKVPVLEYLTDWR